MNVFLSSLAPCPESWNVKCDGQQSIYISECKGGIQRAQIEVIEWLGQQRALWRQKSTRMIPVCVCGDILIVTLRWKVDLIKQTKGASKKFMWRAHNDICAHGISSVCLWVSADLCSNCPSKECFLFHSSYVSNFFTFGVTEWFCFVYTEEGVDMGREQNDGDAGSHLQVSWP